MKKRAVRNGVFGKTLWREKVDWQMKAFQIGKIPWAMALEVSAEFVLQGESNWFNWSEVILNLDFPGCSDFKESACDAGDKDSILVLGRSPGGRNGNQLQYSCLGNPVDRGIWWDTVHRVTQRPTQLKRLSMHTHKGDYMGYNSSLVKMKPSI